MRYFPMIGSIDQAMLDRFTDFYNSNVDEKICIVLNTTGGGYFQAEAIIEMINKHGDASLLIQAAYSAGMIIALSANCYKTLSTSCRGMWHYGTWELTHDDKGKPAYNETECIIKNMPFHKHQSKARAKQIMTPKEYGKFLKDRDIFFEFKRMKQIFPDAGLCSI